MGGTDGSDAFDTLYRFEKFPRTHINLFVTSALARKCNYLYLANDRARLLRAAKFVRVMAQNRYGQCYIFR